mmetsp:Transcript_31337/g.103741  ORF Transcript_31337/g.103741 Transcript_31337/m.103741 type:complete len:274 (+) Transcript_31337:2262-3083(+)
MASPAPLPRRPPMAPSRRSLTPTASLTPEIASSLVVRFCGAECDRCTAWKGNRTCGDRMGAAELGARAEASRFRPRGACRRFRSCNASAAGAEGSPPTSPPGRGGRVAPGALPATRAAGSHMPTLSRPLRAPSGEDEAGDPTGESPEGTGDVLPPDRRDAMSRSIATSSASALVGECMGEGEPHDSDSAGDIGVGDARASLKALGADRGPRPVRLSLAASEGSSMRIPPPRRLPKPPPGRSSACEVLARWPGLPSSIPSARTLSPREFARGNL